MFKFDNFREKDSKSVDDIEKLITDRHGFTRVERDGAVFYFEKRRIGS